MSTNLLRRIVRWCSLVLVWAPIAYLPISLFPLSYVQSVVAQVLVAILAIAAGWVWYREPSLRLRWSPLACAIVVFIAVQWLCAVLGVDWWQSVWSDMARATGLWYQTHIVVAVLIFASPLFTSSTRLQVLKSSVYAACAVAVLAIVQGWNPDLLPNVSVHRVGSTLGNPVLLASYLLLQLGIAAVLVLQARGARGLVTVYGVLAGIALVLAQARGTYLGLAAGIVVAILVWVVLRRQVVTKKRVAWIGGILVAVVVVGSVVGTYVAPVRQWAQGLLGVTSLTTRVINWGVAWEGFLNRPITGWGPENYRRVNDVFYNPALSKVAYVESYVDKPHNQFLELLATSGVVGALAFLVVVSLMIRIVILAYRRGMWGARMVAVLVGVGIGHSVQMFFLFENPGTYLPVALLIGLVVAQEQEILATEVRTARRVPRLLVWVVTGVVGVAAIALSIVPLISTSITNYALQQSYVGAWDQARVYLRYAYQWYTPYQLEQWRWSASSLTDMVHEFAPNHQFAALPSNVQGWVDRDEVWVRGKAEDVLNSQPRTFLLLTLVGRFEYQVGSLRSSTSTLERALGYFREATALSPVREEGYLLQTQVLFTLKRHAEAVQVMEEAIAVAGESVLTDWHYGLALLSVPGKKDEALLYIERAIDKQFVFETAEQVETVTALFVEKKKVDRLVQLYEIVVQQLPGDALWWSRLALAYGQVGRKEEARAAALRAVEIDPSYRAGAEQFLTEFDI